MSTSVKRTSLAAIAALVLGAVLIFAVNLTSAPQAGAQEAGTGLEIRTGQVNKNTSGGNQFQTGRTSVVFADDAQPGEAFSAAVDEVTVVITPVRNLTQADNAPVIAQVSENSRTGFNVRLLNKEIEGIDEQLVRFTFVAYGVDRGAAPAPPAPTPSPEPEPTVPPEVDPDPEPGASLLVDPELEGDPALPQGVTPIGDVAAGAYSAVLGDEVSCYYAFLSSSSTSSIVANALVVGPANITATVPVDTGDSTAGVQADFDADPETPDETAHFVHVDCAA